jgi:hypothetical protein
VRLLTLTALALSLSLPALADHPGPEREMILGVEQLELVRERGGPVLVYKFAKRDFRALRRAKAKPVLRLEIDGQVERVRLERRRGEIKLARDRRGPPSRVHVDVVNRGKRRSNVDITLSLGGVLLDGLDLRVPTRRDRRPPVAVAPPAPPAPPSYGYDRETQRACHNAFFRGQQREACLNAVQRASFHPVNAIRACDRAFTSDSDTLRCVQSIARAPRDPTNEIAQCDRALVHNSDTLRCVERASLARRDLTDDIKACDRAFISGQATATCVETAAQAQRPIRALAQSCDRAFNSDGDVQRCVQSAAFSQTTDAQAQQAIRRCDDYYHSSREALMCVERALPGRVAAR